MPGLHLPVLAAAREAGVPLELGRPLPWLTGRGHLATTVADAPPTVLETLAALHARLGGLAEILATKRAANPPTPDLIHAPTGCIIEVDETQHFTTARLTTLDAYPPAAPLGFDPTEYRQLVTLWRAKGDRAFAHKTAADFPFVGGRQAQRAYNDALRDLLAPTFTGHPVIRLPAPGRSIDGLVDRLIALLDRLH